jgi:hypothetical protein
MLIHRIRGAPRALATIVLLVACLAAPARALDARPLDDTEEGWKKVVAYARCALIVFAAVFPGGAVAAFFGCERTFEAEPPINWGGGS